MIARLVLASLRQRPGRSALLLAGYALGVGVTIALLSIGGAMLDQSRDRTLVGGGDVIVLPAGLDLETFRTGGVSSLYFGIDRARFIAREVLASERHAEAVAAVAPWIEGELLYADLDGRVVPVSAGGEIPSAARALGAGPRLLDGTWEDVEADRGWLSPGDSSLYAELDEMHLPPAAAAGDSTWAEWYYFNVVLPDGWLYLTYMVAGDVRGGRWGGRMLATRVSGDRETVFESLHGPDAVAFREGESGLRIGESGVAIDPDGSYHVSARIPHPEGGAPLLLELAVSSARPRYVPPLSVGGSLVPSGYVVPLLDARATGSVCEGADCRDLASADAYHDHNWGVWRDVTWEWGQANTDDGLSLLYGGVSQAGRSAGSRFLYLFDTGGFLRVLPIVRLDVGWDGGAEPSPARSTLLAARGGDTVRVEAVVTHSRATPGSAEGIGGPSATFHQNRGRFELRGIIDGEPFRTSGRGFFETWSRPPR